MSSEIIKCGELIKNPALFKTIVGVHAQSLVRMIRKFSESQKELWQQVPSLALEADGRTGYSDHLKRAYRDRIWMIESSRQNGFYNLGVNLETGELDGPPYFVSGRYVSDVFILSLALHLDELDANEIIKELKAEIKKKPDSDFDPLNQTAWRKKLREELKLPPVAI